MWLDGRLPSRSVASRPAVRTVLGDVPPDQLGRTHGHEHVLFLPAERFGPDLRRTEEDLAIEELTAFRRAGGTGLIDATVAELGRDPGALHRIAEATGVAVVAATGHTAEEWWREGADPRQTTEEQLEELIMADLTVGFGGTGIRAGVMKVGTSLDRITDAEAKVIRAAARVQRATGAPITTHTTAGTHAAEQLAALESAGADPTRVCVGHLDRRLDWDVHTHLARRGAFLGYDQVSKEKYLPDRERARFVARLVAEGLGDHILLGSDLARRSDLQMPT